MKNNDRNKNCSNTLSVFGLIKILREPPKKNKVFVH